MLHLAQRRAITPGTMTVLVTTIALAVVAVGASNVPVQAMVGLAMGAVTGVPVQGVAGASKVSLTHALPAARHLLDAPQYVMQVSVRPPHAGVLFPSAGMSQLSLLISRLRTA